MSDIVERLLAGAGGGKHWTELHTEAGGCMSKRLGENLGVLANQHGAFSPSEKAEAAFDLVSRIKDLEAKNAELLAALKEALHHVVISPGPDGGRLAHDIHAAIQRNSK